MFGIAVFVMANFWGLSYLMDEQSAATQNLNDLRGKEASNQQWLRQKEDWMSRKSWVDAKQPKVNNKDVPQSELLQALTKSAATSQLKIQEQSFVDSDSTPDYRSVAVRLKVSGPLKNVVQWLVEIQQPQEFQAVTNFSLKSEDQPPTVSLELEVARWYAPRI